MVLGYCPCRFASAFLALILASAASVERISQSAELRVDKASEKSAEKSASNKYLRVIHDPGDRAVSLETAIVSFAPPMISETGARVDLVAAVHIADKKYYLELNKRFANYDSVLYELVAPEGTRIPKGGRKEKGGSNLLSTMQLGMKDLLKLEFQLDQIDYTQENFVHADLSGEQFLKSMRDRQEGIGTIFGRLLAYALAKQAKGDDGGDMQLLMALFDKNRALSLKRVMADQFREMEEMTAVFEGPKGSTLIAERNKRALEVLKNQIALGKKKIAIFYGAGHMADLERRLRADFSLQPNQTQWVQAWNMK
jgi:hypothetical protein